MVRPVRTALSVLLVALGGALALAPGRAEGSDPPTAPAPDFQRQVLPILSDHCFACHGPDAAARRAKLRLDTFDGATAERRSGAAIVPGDPGASLLLERVRDGDPDFRMPPAGEGEPLTPSEISVLARWIAKGAAYDEHWAFRRPVRPEVPAVRDERWPRNPVDRFVLARLEAEGLAPSGEAPRETLVRRLFLDLTGLPPSPADVDAFVADESQDACERLVDRLLASPHHGEHMARPWLDAARYADTHGYHYDNERSMWIWRDGVVDAFNRSVPFDRFTIEQIAGDLLPDATTGQRIASGFHRNHPITWEGGVVPEEYRLEYVADRVQTTAAVWLGLTMGCARCHDHKYDPISQREFYALSAFFDSVPEKGSDGQQGNAAPVLRVPGEDQARRLAELDARVAALEERRAAPDPELDAAQRAYEAEARARLADRWSVARPVAARSTDERVVYETLGDGSVLAKGAHPARETQEILLETDRTRITALRVDALAHASLPDGGPGRASHANFVLSEVTLEAALIGEPERFAHVELVAAHADHSQQGFFVGGALDGDRKTGWAVQGSEKGTDRIAVLAPRAPFGHEGGTLLRIRLAHESDYAMHSIGRVRVLIATDDASDLQPTRRGLWWHRGPFLEESPEEAFAAGHPPRRGDLPPVDAESTGAGTAAAGQGAGAWTPRPDLADGAVHELSGTNAANYLFRTLFAPTARTVTVSLGSDDGFRLLVNREVVAQSDAPRGAASDQDLVRLPLREGRNDLLLEIVNYSGPSAFYFELRDDHAHEPPLDVASVLVRPETERSARQRTWLRDRYRREHAPGHRELLDALAAARDEKSALEAEIPTVMVMDELAEPRETFVRLRGRYDRPGERVEPGTPSVLPPLRARPGAAESEPTRPTRLDLARWLVSDEQPLTPRVVANRLWSQVFGHGLVHTPEDFGLRGAPPSHPELLDWLAVELVESGWDVKGMLRLLVTSATYRQSSSATAELRVRDPANRLYARAPRFRLAAETIRDQALAVSGLLVRKLGGPPVRPYQPAGLWAEVGSDFNSFTANRYEQDHGESLYRRSLYTFWKRTLPPPSARAFDAPTREFCVVRRSRTNTPLQALVLWNDPTYVEAARALAARMMRDADAPGDRSERGVRLVLARSASPEEIATLVALAEDRLGRYRADPAAARALLDVGEHPSPVDLDPAELAAWTLVASVLLNLDETLTRE